MGLSTPLFEDTRSVFKVCVMGGDRTLHHILCNYVALWHTGKEMCQKLNIAVFLVPTSREGCDLATFVAQHDGWYRRQIYSAFSTPPTLIPRMREPDGDL